jgi:hypothetical protein
MIKILAICTVLWAGLYNIFLQATGTYSGDLGPDDTLQWSSYYRLTTDDFMGVPDKNSNHAAITATGILYYINYSADNSLVVNTEAVFYKKFSWFNRDLISDYFYALKHEQGHFDIAEIFARRLRVALYRFLQDPANKDVDVQNVFDEIMAEEKAMQQLYDKETQNSTNARKQYEWDRKIYNLLREGERD